jgi:AcrR family transcriptional regulator
MAEQGVRGLRLEDVAARADVAVSLIYYHFGNRIDLLRATFQFVSDQSPSTVMIESGGPNAFHCLEAGMVNEFVRPRARVYAVAWSELTTYAVFESDMRVEIDATNRTWVKSIKEVIEAGQIDGSIQKDIVAHDEAEILTSLLDGLVFRWISHSISAERGADLIRIALRQHLVTKCVTAIEGRGDLNVQPRGKQPRRRRRNVA